MENLAKIEYQWCQIGNGLVGSVDQHLTCHINSFEDMNVPLGIDLTQVEFIEPASLIVILAIICNRKSLDQRTMLRLPKSSDVRRILSTWHFITSLTDITIRPNGPTTLVKRYDSKTTSNIGKGIERKTGALPDSYELSTTNRSPRFSLGLILRLGLAFAIT